MKAVILAGGIGTRLRPLTYLVPKVMLPMGGKPLLEHTVAYLEEYGITEIVLCVAYLRNRIKEHFRDGTQFGARIEYAEADRPLGTAGQLATAKDHLNETFIAMNGDIVTSLNLRNLIETHRKSKSIATIALKNFDLQFPYGYVEVDTDQSLKSFREKPTLSYRANTGVYVMEPAVFNYIKKPPPVTLERDVFPTMIANGEKLDGYYEDAYWADVGTVSDFEKVDKELISKNLERA